MFVSGRGNSAGTPRELIDKLSRYNGTFYLPYLLNARKDQFERSYPGYRTFIEIKQKYDPTGRFKNMLWKTYFEGAQSAAIFG
jgi:FAD/FMN-containing dehydrogenase